MFHNTGLQTKIQGINFQFSVSFYSADYEYERHFFSSRPDFPRFHDKGLKINKIICLQVVFMMKLTNRLNVLLTWSVSQGILFTLMHNFKLKMRSFPKKVLQNKFIIMLRDVYNTGLHFSTFFLLTGKWFNYSISFFLLNTNIKAIFSYHVQLPWNFTSKV